MTGRSCASRPLVVFTLAAAVAGCGEDRAPRRVPADGAPCSAVMPGPATSGEKAIRLDAVGLTERSWTLLPPQPRADAPKATTVYFVRRGDLPAGSALRDAALLDAAAARVARGVALQDGTKPRVARVATGVGEAVELRWETGTLHNATRLLLAPGGYCEVTILRAPADADVTSYFASVLLRP
ncbi:MAG: hypothetical protein ABIT71_05265 [Vicinamibacteraceae bacterium]